MDDKTALRKKVKALKSQLNEEQKATEAGIVFSNIATLEAFKNATNVLVYASLPDELPTNKFISEIAVTKSVFLPRVKGSELEILPYQETEVHTGAYSIMEPNGIETISPTKMDIIIVPAVALSQDGYRLGRGKGFYDRLLCQTNAIKIGVSLSCQLFNEIPHESHDVKMDYIVTSNHLISVTKSQQL